MINDESIKYEYRGVLGHALVWVIDNECLYDMPLNDEYADLFLLSDEIVDVSDEYPSNHGLTVRFLKNGTPIEDFNTSEYFGSILLSPHMAINLNGHPYGYYVVSPNAKFEDNKFFIIDQDMTTLEEFPDTSLYRECNTMNCHCYKEKNV